MSVTADATDEKGVGYDLSGYDIELRYEWGPWVYRNSAKGHLGYPKTSVLHSSHGLGSADNEAPEMVKKVDAIVTQLPTVMQKAAKEWWAFNQCISKRAVCRELTDWYRSQGVTKNVQSRDLDVWLNAVAMAVWIGLGGENE